MNTFNLALDLAKAKQRQQQTIFVRQGDQNGTTIVATITDHGVAASTSGMTARFQMRLPDGTHYYRKAASLSGNVATVALDEAQAASAVGRTDVAYFQLLQGSTVVASTESFTVIVLPDALADATVPESYDSAIQDAIDNANAAAGAAWEAAQQTIPDGSITPPKLASGAVTADKIADAVRKGYVRSFETVAAMQAATDLKAGMTCHTNGFHASGDGGSAYYTIATNGTPNGMDVIGLANNLFASLVYGDRLSYSMLGAALDGMTDDANIVSRCHVLANLLGLPVVQGHGTLLGRFSSVVVNTSLDLHGMTLIIDNDTPKELYLIQPRDYIASVTKNLAIDKSTNFSFSDADLRGKFFLMHGANMPEWFIGTRTTSTETSNNYYSYPVVTDDYGFKVSSPFDLSYSGNITLRNVHDVNQPRIVVCGCRVENRYTQSGSFPTVFHVMRSCVNVCDISVVNVAIADLETSDPNAYDMKGLIHIDQCANVNVANISAFNNSNQALMSAQYNSYILRISYAFNVNIENVMATQYWGWMASVFVDTIRLANSIINRFDFHFGINGNCTLSNVTFRNQDNSVGIRVGCGYGNIQVVNCKFIDVYMISFRNDFTDTGLGFGGSIQMVNCNHQYTRDATLAAISAYVGVSPAGSNFTQKSPSIMLNGCTFDSNNTILAMPAVSVYDASTEPLLFDMRDCICNKSARFTFRHRNVVTIKACNFLGGATIDFANQDIDTFKHVISDLVVRNGRLTINGGNSMVLVSNIVVDGSFVFDTSHFAKQIILSNAQFYTSAANITSSIAAMANNVGNLNWKWCYSVSAIDRSSLPGGVFGCQNIS